MIFQFTLLAHSDHEAVCRNCLNCWKAELLHCTSRVTPVGLKYCFTIAVLSHAAPAHPVLEET